MTIQSEKQQDAPILRAAKAFEAMLDQVIEAGVPPSAALGALLSTYCLRARAHSGAEATRRVLEETADMLDQHAEQERQRRAEDDRVHFEAHRKGFVARRLPGGNWQLSPRGSGLPWHPAPFGFTSVEAVGWLRDAPKVKARPKRH